jgi:hypothetical protein
VAGSSDPITISPHTTPIEVTEVLASEPSIEQLYTLFYDIGGNTLPGAVPAPGSNMSLPHTVLPPISLPKSDSLDIDLGIPDSIQSTKSARAQGALKQSPGTLGGATPASKAPATGTRSFTYEDKPASAPGAEPPTGLGPMTEIPRDMEFQVTQPGLDLDLTTNIVPVTNLDALTVMLPQEGEGAGKVATAPVKMAGTTPAQAPVPVPVPAPVPAPAAPPAAGAPRHPVGLELDLTTDIGRGTELGPLTVIPKDDEGPKTRVELDLDLNTNIVPLRSTEEGQDRESDPFAITTIPSAWDKKKPRS